MLNLFMMLALTGGPIGPPVAVRPAIDNPAHTAESGLLTDIQHRAFRFFWEQADLTTGLVKDRASNRGSDTYTVASIASTGYGLAALPVAVEHRWIGKEDARRRALKVLRFLRHKMPNTHGWYYHFVDMRSGERVWKCEVSTIDTSLLVCGALCCGQFFRGDVKSLADELYDGLDWTWARANGGAKPGKPVVTMGWKPESSFLPSDWDSYCELPLVYLLGLGAKPVRREGERDGRWVLLDYVDIVVHVQHSEERTYYSLERLWKDCPELPLPDAARPPA